jgi:hypothetical protein
LEVPLSCKFTRATLRLVFFPTLALAVLFSAAPLYAQCPGRQLPAGSVLVTQNSGTFTAPGNGKFAYSPFPIDLTRFPSGGTLTIVATVGNGMAKASFLVWPGNAVMMADGTPSDSLRVTADPGNADGAPGSCVAVIYRFLQPQTVVFGVTGGWFQALGATNTFDFSAYVQPTGGRIAPAATSSSTTSSPGPRSIVTSSLMQSVWIQNAPSVPDTGGHSILGGILRGNLSAVEPNLVICVTPTGTSGGRRTCTDICPPGHYCQKEFGGGVRLNGAHPSVHVEVLDNDKQGKISQLAAFDESDARKCLPDQPCMVNTAESIPMSVSFGFGNPKAQEGCVVSASGWGPDPVLVASTMFMPGLLPAQTSTPAPTKCSHFSFTSYSGDITSQQLFSAFQSLYNGSTSFHALMDRVGTAKFQRGKASVRYQVNVIVVSQTSGTFHDLYNLALSGYACFEQNHPNTAGYQKPDPEHPEFAFTLGPDADGAINVIISAPALEYGYYKGLSRTPGAPPLAKIMEPIQLVLAYELGTNVAGRVLDPSYTEQPHQEDTNKFLQEAFTRVDKNTKQVTGFIPNSNWEPDQNGQGTEGASYWISGGQQFEEPKHGVLALNGTSSAFVQPPPYFFADPPGNQVQTIYGDGTSDTAANVNSIPVPASNKLICPKNVP